jgi:hypothetical protein
MSKPLKDRLQFFFTKSFFRIVPVIAFGLICLLFVYAYQLEIFFNNAPKTMTAPFVQTTGTPAPMVKTVQGRLKTQNFSGRDMADKIEIILPEILTFHQGTIAKGKVSARKYFTDSGYAQYLQFLASSGMEQGIATQDLQSGVFLERPPLEISAGVFSGTYKWLMEVPVILNFIPRAVQTYRNTETPQSRKFTIRIQLTRVQDAADPDAVKIEIWQAIPTRS